MEPREIKALVTLMREYGLVELEIEDKKGKVRLVRAPEREESGNQVGQAPVAAKKSDKSGDKSPAVNLTKGSSKTDHRRQRAQTAAPPVPQLTENQKLVTSPMVGTFYRAASPGAAPFVEEGSQVRRGQPLCIIEAMKMMNEIEAEVAGTVVRFLCENAQPVEYGQPLMILQID
jgi:acetyl-CoA carboxylase biotin carboxyl carrier protein